MHSLSNTCLTTALAISAICATVSASTAARGIKVNHDQPFEDKDGRSTQSDSRTFSNRSSKAAVVVCSIAGLVCSTSVVLVSSSAESPIDSIKTWLPAAPWALFVFQAACLIACHGSIASYNMGARLALSAVVYGLALLVRFQSELEIPGPPVSTLVRGLELSRAFLTVALAISSVLIPRRPVIYSNGHRVDDMYGATLLSRLTFNWAWHLPMFAQAWPTIDTDDMPVLPYWTRSLHSTMLWSSVKVKTPLAWALLRIYWKDVAAQWALGAVQGSASYAIYWTNQQFLETIESWHHDSPVPTKAWPLVAWLSLAIISSEWLEQYIHWLGWGELNNRVRGQLPAITFDKLMRRKNVDGITQHASKSTSGNQDVNVAKARKGVQHLWGDAEKCATFAGQQEIWVLTVFKLVTSVAFLVRLMGWVPLGAGLCSFAVVLPCGMYSAKLYQKAVREWIKVRDRKQTIVSESTNSLRQIKFAAAEAEWEQRIVAVRGDELRALWRLSLANTANTVFWLSSPIALAAVSLAAYVYIHGSLTPSLTFVSLTAFRRLEGAMSSVPKRIRDADRLSTFQGLITYIADFAASITRIQTYLESPELDSIVTRWSGCSHLSFINATFAWPTDDPHSQPNGQDRFMLSNVNVHLPLGELSIVHGQTGSGKSLFLEGLLGEVDLLSGSIEAPSAPTADERRDDKANASNWVLEGATAFVGQTPWIENASVRDNILFGLPMQTERYARVLEACALVRDLDTLPDGDESELGVNGINLSGGQKWRVSLARAIYSRAGILIMDDIFSAVDAHVGRHIFERCISGDLCRGRTIVLATHHVDLCLPKARVVLELAGGAVKSLATNKPPPPQNEVGGLSLSLTAETPSPQDRSSQQLPMVQKTHPHPDQPVSANPALTDSDAPRVPRKPRKFVYAESRTYGAVRAAIYWAYLRAAGNVWWAWWAIVLVGCVSVQTTVLGRSWWLKIWSSRYESLQTEGLVFRSVTPTRDGFYASSHFSSGSISLMRPSTLGRQNDDNDQDADVHFYLTVYLLISASSIAVAALHSLFLAWVGFRSGRTLFMRLVRAVFRAPLIWIDTTPAARILNRFIVDSADVDRRLMEEVQKFTSHIFILIGIVVAALLVSPFFIVLTALCIVAVFFVSRYHIITKRPIKRLESVSRSPIFGLLASGLAGITTIRAYGQTAHYTNAAYKAIDTFISCSWHIHICNHWIGLAMGMIGAAFTTAVAIFVLLRHVDAALAGFALSFAIELTSSAIWVVRTFVAVENNMNAMERIAEYSSIETEPSTGDIPPAAWPNEGRVQVNDLVVAYAPDLPPVLRGVTFDVRGGERIGIIGRTGAGKSSLTLALFRLLEAKSGSIHIDGLDIARLELRELRSRLTVIPQDPRLFSGTVRANLDPFGKHDDETLRDALGRVSLLPPQPSAGSVPGSDASSDTLSINDEHRQASAFYDLPSPIAEGGRNLSHGQRQLLCLARAIVERPRILLLDEATSAVDMATDRLIQRSIRDEFSTCTLIVIAHRLSTVADFDRILVLDDGQVTQFGSPKDLWQIEDGLFRSLCESSGERDELDRIINKPLMA